VRKERRDSQPGHGREAPDAGDHGRQDAGARRYQARELLDTPTGHTLKAKGDGTILATLLCYTLRRDDLYKLRVKGYVPRAARTAASEVVGQRRHDPPPATAPELKSIAHSRTLDLRRFGPNCTVDSSGGKPSAADRAHPSRPFYSSVAAFSPRTTT
jgi:hypothetical protein